MNFAYTILYVDNVSETLSFYEKAFGLQRKMLHESGDYGELQSGDTTLGFAARTMIADDDWKPSVPNPSSPSFEIALTTEDVVKAVQKAVDAGSQLIKEPDEKPWGQTVAYVSDNSGFIVEICTPMMLA